MATNKFAERIAEITEGHFGQYKVWLSTTNQEFVKLNEMCKNCDPIYFNWYHAIIVAPFFETITAPNGASDFVFAIRRINFGELCIETIDKICNINLMRILRKSGIIHVPESMADELIKDSEYVCDAYTKLQDYKKTIMKGDNQIKFSINTRKIEKALSKNKRIGTRKLTYNKREYDTNTNCRNNEIRTFLKINSRIKNKKVCKDLSVIVCEYIGTEKYFVQKGFKDFSMQIGNFIAIQRNFVQKYGVSFSEIHKTATNEINALLVKEVLARSLLTHVQNQEFVTLEKKR